jgi:hypothetical protein
MAESDQARAEALLRRLAGGPSTSKADEVAEKLTEKSPQRTTEKSRVERTLVFEVGKTCGPAASLLAAASQLMLAAGFKPC